MANFNVRVPDEMVARFDAWASARGANPFAACRWAIQDRANASSSTSPTSSNRSSSASARSFGTFLAAALIRRRLTGRPTFGQAESLALAAIQADLRRIGVNANQIARALNTAVLEGKVLDLELAYLDELRAEIRAHMLALREAVEGNLGYWDAEP